MTDAGDLKAGADPAAVTTRLLSDAAEGVDPLLDGADAAAAAAAAPLRLEQLREALDVVEERLARVEASGSASSR